jgi:tetratricopeptide (TPR) repeat protein
MTLTRTSALRVALAVALLFFALAATGSATAAPPDDGCLRDPECREHYDKAYSLYEKGRYEAALPEFQAAYQLRQMPWLLINIGRTLHRLGRLEEAITYYQRYQRAAPNGDPETARKVQEYITQAKVLLEVKTTSSSGPGGTPALPPDPTGPGQNDLTKPTPSTVAAATPATQPGPSTPTGEKPFYKKWWFWTAVGGGAAVILITGIAVGASRAGPADPIPMDATVYRPMF